MTYQIEVTILIDNRPGDGLLYGWGFSVYIDLGDKAILFDADTDPEAIKYNIERLGIDVNKIKFSVLSHYHRDHYGGFKYFGKVIKGLKVYVPPGDVRFLREYGIEPLINYESNQIEEDVWIIGPFKSKQWGFYEQALAISLHEEGTVLFIGCAHVGIDTIAYEAYRITGSKLYWVLGGFHSPTESALDKLSTISKYISPAHCSGERCRRYLSSKYPDKYIDVSTGFRIRLPSFKQVL